MKAGDLVIVTSFAPLTMKTTLVAHLMSSFLKEKKSRSDED
jgi:hypothetical protein